MGNPERTMSMTRVGKPTIGFSGSREIRMSMGGDSGSGTGERVLSPQEERSIRQDKNKMEGRTARCQLLNIPTSTNTHALKE